MKYLPIIAITLLMAIVMIAGCMSTQPVDDTPQIGSTVSSASIFNGGYTWYEYTTTTAHGNNEIKTNIFSRKYETTYQGQPAIETKTTRRDMSGMNIMNDIYWDSGFTTALSGTTNMTLTNGSIVTKPITADQLQHIAVTNVVEPTYFEYNGTSTIIIPAGRFDTTMYIKPGTGTTYWAASGVPIPVEIYGTSPSGTFVTLLDGWG